MRWYDKIKTKNPAIPRNFTDSFSNEWCVKRWLKDRWRETKEQAGASDEVMRSMMEWYIKNNNKKEKENNNTERSNANLVQALFDARCIQSVIISCMYCTAFHSFSSSTTKSCVRFVYHMFCFVAYYCFSFFTSFNFEHF